MRIHGIQDGPPVCDYKKLEPSHYVLLINLRRLSLASQSMGSLNLHQYVKFLELALTPQLVELNFLLSNAKRFSGVTHFSTANMFCGEDILEMDMALDLMRAFGPQLSSILTHSDLYNYSSVAASSLNPNLIESLVALPVGYSASDLAKVHFKRLKHLSVNSRSPQHLEWLKSVTSLHSISITCYNDKKAELFSCLREIVAANPQLRLLNLELFSSNYDRAAIEDIFNVTDSAENLQKACMMDLSLTLSRLRIRHLTVWQALMLTTPSDMDATKCKQLFQICHGDESPMEKVSSIMGVLNRPEIMSASNFTWRQHPAMQELLGCLENQISVATDSVMEAGMIAPLKLVLAHVVVIIIRALVPDRDVVLKYFKVFESLLEKAEQSPDQIFSGLSRQLRLGSPSSIFMSLCVNRKSLVEKYSLATVLGDFSTQDDPQLFIKLINDPSGAFLELLPRKTFSSSKWARSIITECDDVAVPFETKRRIIDILSTKNVRSIGSCQVPAYFERFFDDDDMQNLCMKTITVFPSLLHRFVKADFGIRCMKKYGNLDLVKKLAFSEGKLFPGLLESPFRVNVHDSLWGAVLCGDADRSGVSIQHWVECLLKFGIGNSDQVAAKIEKGTLRSKGEMKPSIKALVLELLSQKSKR
jgi:hypothetical protein